MTKRRLWWPLSKCEEEDGVMRLVCKSEINVVIGNTFSGFEVNIVIGETKEASCATEGIQGQSVWVAEGVIRFYASLCNRSDLL